jgi:hypothetical protein
MGVTVTFVAILELVREGLIEIVQTEPFAPLHVRPAGSHRGLRLVANNERGEEEVIAADVPAQPEGPTADELLLASQEPFEDDTTFELEEDLPLVGVDVPAVAVHAAASAPTDAPSRSDVALTDEQVGGDVAAAAVLAQHTDEAEVTAASEQHTGVADVTEADAQQVGEAELAPASAEQTGEVDVPTASEVHTGEAEVPVHAAPPAGEHVDEVGSDADASGEKPTNADEVG